ncbi:MAG: NAD+ synthase [Pseudomonadota bacterium]
MADHFRLTLAQLNATVGDFAANRAAAARAHAEGAAAGADLVMLPEMFLTGYQTQDLGRRRAFVADAQTHLNALAKDLADGPALGIGLPLFEGEALYNAYVILSGGEVVSVVRKQMLPNDDVFDEKRIYTAADPQGPVSVSGVRLGIAICEDGWHEGPTETLEESGAEILLVPNGSPFNIGKRDIRMTHMVSRVVESGLPLVYLNLVGGQDDQVFDGDSFVLNPGGVLAAQMPMFEEQILHVDFERSAEGFAALPQTRASTVSEDEMRYHAMVLGLQDYIRKSGFSQVLLGLSGGVDSALVAAIAVDALGPENVRCVMLPSEYTSAHSLEDATGVAQMLGVRLDEIAISDPRAAVTTALAPLFEGTAPDITEENIQSRLRGLLLMAMSNKFGAMLLTTGNKSEVAVGYATIYGDMSGGYNPLKDLYKTEVFAACRWRNSNHRAWMLGPEGEVMPTRVIEKPPSAELREDQKDEDSLPPYDVLDDILVRLVDRAESVAEVAAAGHERAVVERIEHLIFVNEWKRYQAAPGPRLSDGAFWLDRRYPIVNRWRDRG